MSSTPQILSQQEDLAADAIAHAGEAAVNNGNGIEDGGDKTVFDDPSGFNVKHPLYSSWTLYFSSPNVKNVPKTPTTAAGGAAAAGWMDDMRKVAKFDSVEEFWGLHNNIVVPSNLGIKADYYLFKEDIIPAWEDPANKNGGKWSVQLPKEKTKGHIDQMWLYTMLAAIGETYETDADGKDMGDAAPDDLVTGVIVNVRPNFFRLNIWTRQAPENPHEPSPLMDRISKIGRHFKHDVLGYALEDKLMSSGYSTEVEFIGHKDGEKKLKSKKVVI